MDTNKINELAKILRQNQLTKLDLTEGDNRIVLEAGGNPVAKTEIPVSPVGNAIEFPSLEEAESFVAPDWFGKDVSEEKAYKNTSLSLYGMPKEL